MSTNGTVKTYPAIVPDKLQPQNSEAEMAFLGCIFISQDALILSSHVNLLPSDFYIKRNHWIFEAMLSLQESNQPIDVISVSDQLEKSKKLSTVGGSAYLSQVINSTISYFHAPGYAEIIKRLSIRRQIINAAGEMSRLGFNDEIESNELVEKSTDLLAGISKRNLQRSRLTLRDLSNSFLDRLDRIHNCENGITGLPTGLMDVDKLLAGLQKADYIVLAGRPSMGKSALALQIAIDSARDYGAKSLIYAREMSEQSLHERMVAYESGVDLSKIRRGQLNPMEYDKVLKAADMVTRYNITIDSDTDTPEAMKARAILEKETNGLDLIIVDYLQRVRVGRDRRYNNKSAEIGEISGMMKDMAKVVNVPNIVISSLSRQCEMRNDKRPHLSDLRESGDIEYDADIVGFLYRDEVYNQDSEFKNMAELNIEKNRQGPLGNIMLGFKKETTSFFDVVEDRTSLDWING